MPNRDQVDPSTLIRCSVCEAVNRDKKGDIYCHRCGSRIFRNPKLSTSRAWAFLITALILYIPANLYPILISEDITSKTINTIIGGVIVLWEEGSYPIALIILVASVLVPILKFIVLLYLLINANLNKRSYSRVDQHRLHYMTEIIGPWSMVDVFVVAILTGLVHVGQVKVIAGPGATAFVLMVLFTMFAALAIDTRLFKEKEKHGRDQSTDH